MVDPFVWFQQQHSHYFCSRRRFIIRFYLRCPPCKAIKPLYEQLAAKYPDVAFGKVDIDDNSDAALEFKISAVPTFVFFDGEDPIERFSGADPNMLESLVKNLDAR
jgi:thioredoxin 1